MKHHKGKYVLIFILVVLTFGVTSLLVSNLILVERPTQEGIIEDWGQICFWPDVDGLSASVSPKGCYSTTCTSPKLQVGTAIVDVQNRKIQLETRFVLVKASRFLFPCVENCNGGGAVQFIMEPLIPDDYATIVSTLASASLTCAAGSA